MTTSERFQEIQGLFHEALQLGAAEREAFLNSGRLEDQGIRDEVRSLLAEDAREPGFLTQSPEPTRALSLSAGNRVGHYQISELIGRGGMGEVYRARDLKLGRDVALKVLPQHFAGDPERVARFRREAQLLAALNDPHIGALYGLEERDGVLALVMELVEGPTLADLITERRMSVDEALSLARQIAQALESAHERGIVHRDLKPTNIKVTGERLVKVLDFGLGKLVKPDIARPECSPAAETRVGAILGTAPYMSPEQVRAAAVDERTDIWAFGVVLYEMLTGRRPFQGDTVSDTIAAVLTQEPDWRLAPVEAQRLLRNCLQKDPKRRLRDIADGWALLDSPPNPPSINHRNHWIRVAAFLGMFAVAAGLGWRIHSVQTEVRQLIRLDVDLGSDVSLSSLRGADVMLSPDGTRLLYVSRSRLFTRPLDQPGATELAGTEGAYAPFFSPDGRWVAFFALGKLKKIPIQGGPAVAVCDAPYGSGGSWSDDGNIIAALEISGLSKIPSTGGVPTPITELAPGEASHRWPQILPGGRAVLFSSYTSTSGLEQANIEVMSLADRRRKTLQRGATWGRYLPDGHLSFISNGTLFAVPFDLDRLETHGAPVPVLDGVAYSTTSGSAELSFSGEQSGHGTLVYRSGAGAGLSTVQWIDSRGRTKPVIATPGNYLAPSLSPDGKRLALTSGGDIWIYDFERETMTRLTSDGGYGHPVWTANGRFVVFYGREGIFWISTDGTGHPQQLIQSKNLPNPWSFDKQGIRLAFVEMLPEKGSHIWTVPVQSDSSGLHAGKPELFLQSAFNERSPAFSPDGRWLAYSSDESDSLQVYVQAFPHRSGKVQISSAGGVFPVWSGDGRELFYTNLENQLMAVRYRLQGESVTFDKPRLWLDKRLPFLPPTRSYDVEPDAKRVVAIMPVQNSEFKQDQHHVTFLLNFLDYLRRRVPTDGKPTR